MYTNPKCLPQKNERQPVEWILDVQTTVSMDENNQVQHHSLTEYLDSSSLHDPQTLALLVICREITHIKAGPELWSGSKKESISPKTLILSWTIKTPNDEAMDRIKSEWL